MYRRLKILETGLHQDAYMREWMKNPGFGLGKDVPIREEEDVKSQRL